MIEQTLEPARAADPSFEWPIRDQPAEHKRRANDFMRDGLRALDPDEQIPFFCECDRSDCFAPIWLTGSVYDRTRTRSAPLLAHPETRHSLAAAP